MKRADIDLLLPEIFRRTLPPIRTEANPLEAFLDVMELLHTPDEAVLAALETYFDPYRAPDVFVNYLAGWVDLDRLWIENPQEFTAKTLPPFPSGVGRLRELVASAAFLSRWRGTMKGLLHFLETATGVTGFVIDERVPDADGQPIPFHVLVRAPKAAGDYRVLIEHIIMKEKPAYVTYDLQIDAQ
jgi:phage tail-like protein